MTCFVRSDGKSVRQWCKENGISYGAVWHHLEDGLSADDACKEALKKKGQRFSHPKYFYKGKALVDVLGAKTNAYKYVIDRIRKGMTVDEAVENYVKTTGYVLMEGVE